MLIIVLLSVQSIYTFWLMTPLLIHDTICTMGRAEYAKQYDSALARCEETAEDRGHNLGGVWYPVDERLRASICVLCGAMVWVTRPGQEKHWRIGGTALEKECLQEEESQATRVGA